MKDEPAFPIKGDPQDHYCSGLTKREYFAGLILANFTDRINPWKLAEDDGDARTLRASVKASVVLADALMAELSKGQGE